MPGTVFAKISAKQRERLAGASLPASASSHLSIL